MKSLGWDTSFHLNGKFPLLDNSIFPTLNAARNFVEDSTSSAIAGTVIGVDDHGNMNESGLYEIYSKNGELALRKLISVDTLAEYKEGVDSIITNYEDNYNSALQELALTLADLLEALRDDVFSPDNDTTPVTRTMMLLVGSDSTNYRFSTTAVGGKDTDGVVFDTESRTLLFLQGVLYHFSIVDDAGTPKSWSVTNSPIIELADETESSSSNYMSISSLEKGSSLWIYVRVERSGSNGTWFVSPKKYGCVLKEGETLGEGINPGNSTYYYLLYGFCGVTKTGTPFFEPIYGNTWIKGSTIYTGKVLTMNGFSSLDLDNNTLKLGNDFYYADGLIIIGNPETGAFVFHKHGTDKSALHVGTRTLDTEGNESWNGMTFADGELTIGKYDEQLLKMQNLLDKEVSTWYGNGIPLPYRENSESNIITEVSDELQSSYNTETLIETSDGILKFNLSTEPELLTYHINDIYINTADGTGYRLVVTDYNTESLEVYWLKLSLGDLLNILKSINAIDLNVQNIKSALDITGDGLTIVGDSFILTMMLRIGSDSTNYTLSKTSTSGNRMVNLSWGEVILNKCTLSSKENETLTHNSYYYKDNDLNKYLWTLTSGAICTADLTDSTTPIYIYIKCSKITNTAIWDSSSSPKGILDSLYYYFPFGTIVDLSKKTLVEVRGNTKIIGDRIITGKLESNTGNSFFDLDNGLFALGVDLSYPGDLSKAAFSFDGSKVHIGGAGYTWVEKNKIERFNLGISSIPDNKYIGQVQGLTKLLLNTEAGGEFLIKYSLGVMASDPDLLISESTFGMEGNSPYCICIGEPDVNSTTNKLTNELYDFSKDSDGQYVCLFSTLNALDIYIIRGEVSKNGELYNFTTNDEENGDLYFYIYDILLNLWGPNTEDKGLRASLLMGSTDISGGLVLTNCLGVRDSYGIVTAGLCGINDDNNKVAFWAGGTLDNKEIAPVRLTFSGTGSQVGPLRIISDSLLGVFPQDETSQKRFYIDNSGEACIKILDGNNNLKILASPIETNITTVNNTSVSWDSGLIYSGTKMGEGNTSSTTIDLLTGTIGLTKTENPSNGTYSHTVNSYNTYPAPVTLLFIGNINNTYNTFGLVADINLYVKDSNDDWKKVTTLATINNPVTIWQNRDNGFKRLDSDHKSFLVTFKATPNSDFISLDNFGKQFKIALVITHLSRWWASTSSSGNIIIENGTVKDKNTLKSWSISLISNSSLAIRCTYTAKFTANAGGSTSGSVGIKHAQGLMAPEGLLFIKDRNMFAVKVADSELIIALSGLKTDTNATPLGIDSNGHLCKLK